MTDWGPVLLILGVGLATGAIFFLLFARGGKGGASVQAAPDIRASSGPEAEPSTTRVRDLRARRDHLIERLQTLPMESHRDEAEQAKQRQALEIEAAKVLRDLDAAERQALARPQPTAAPDDAPARPGSAFRGFAWGLGSAAFLALLVAFVLQGSKERREGGPLTGGVPGIEFGAPPSAAAEADPELRALMAAAAAHPSDVDLQLALIQGLVYRDQLIAAWDVIQKLSAIAPAHPRKLMYEATVREAMGQFERAKELLDQAVAGDPSLSEAWVRRGLVSFELGDWSTAVTSWEKALAQRPDGKGALEPVIAEAKRRLAEGVPPPERPAPEAPPIAQRPDTAPGAGQPGAQPGAQPADPGDIRLTLDLSAAARSKLQPGAVVFITARPAGVTSGPPLAAKRVPAAEFPMQLRLGQADSMMGQPFPEATAIEARLDADGNAMTRDPNDPTAAADGVRRGSELRLVLE